MKDGLFLLAWLMLAFLPCLAWGGEGPSPAPAAVEPSLPMPVGQVKTQDELVKEYFFAAAVPFDDPKLAYRILLPKGWASVELEVDEKERADRLVPLGHFQRKDPLGVVEVSYVRLEHDVKPEDWLRFYARGNAMKILAVRHVDYSGQRAVEMLVRYEVDEEPMVARLSLRSFGKWLVLVSGVAPKAAYKGLAVDLAVSCAGFRFEHPPKEKWAVPLREEVMERKAHRLLFKWPSDWRTVRDRDVPEGVALWDIRWKSKTEDLGYLRLKAYDRARRPAVNEINARDAALKEIESAGIKVSKLMFKDSVQLPNLKGSAKVFYYRGTNRGVGNDLIVACARTPETIFSLVSLRPVLSRNPWAWMVGKRAFEILMQESKVSAKSKEK